MKKINAYNQYNPRPAELEIGLYHPNTERSSCGVGMIASIDSSFKRDVVTMGVKALAALGHRGAIDADGKTGDGAGIHVAIPVKLLTKAMLRTAAAPTGNGRMAAGMIFLPRNDLAAQDKCREIIERHLRNNNWRILGWRQVPINPDALGEKGERTRPEIEQIVFETQKSVSAEDTESDLMLCRRCIENDVNRSHIRDFHVSSFSCRSIIYKGLFQADQLSEFYPDLQNPDMESNFAIFHQRYSTNTFPSWPLAQPFRILAHNGEINTISANRNWMRSHETRFAAKRFDKNIEELKPVIAPGMSDSSALDAVFELLVRSERELPEVKSLIIPEAWEQVTDMPQKHRDFYAYGHNVIEPWDGPAAICAYDGRWILAGMDRNGLRPMRYQISKDGILVAGSESGMIKFSPSEISESGHIGPGNMIAVDLVNGKLMRDKQLKDIVAQLAPFGQWAKRIKKLQRAEYTCTKPKQNKKASGATPQPKVNITGHMTDVGLTDEDLEIVLHAMATEAKEPTASMGDDSPLAVLSKKQRPFHHFFRQTFAQVTNPPIDSIRERYVMSLTTRIGNLMGNILEENEAQMEVLQIDSPVLMDEDFNALQSKLKNTTTLIETTVDKGLLASKAGKKSSDDIKAMWLGKALRRIQDEAAKAVRLGRPNLILSDKKAGPDRMAVPMILAAAAVHTHLSNLGLRSHSSVCLQTREALDPHSYAVMIGVGATMVHPWLACELIRDRWQQGLFATLDYQQVAKNYLKAVNDGLLKIMSKMGVSVISSYRGGYLFEAVGLSRALVAEFFPGLPSRISGIGLEGIGRRIIEQQNDAWSNSNSIPPVGSFMRFRVGGAPHYWNPDAIKILRKACTEESVELYNEFLVAKDSSPPINLRDLMQLQRDPKSAVPIAEVESVTEIRKRMVAPGISLGALSPEAHETIAIAMNRIGSRSDSGEGGEDPARFVPKSNGDNASSAIKQIASGRFGVTAEYLNNCQEIEIKMAQGAKPGEGGQLPGYKVSSLIARLRHSTKGVTLISPPPHHDIYSIEDLAQLIHDLKQINPRAKICVKLVACNGIGAVAAGVAKAHADVILISGHSGGTGASPATSIKFAGLPWEMGLAEAHQVLCLNGLRSKVRLRVDGGLSSGRDLAIAIMLGADEFGIGTASLIALGCLMVRQCHSNTCPVGICTQDDKLRSHFRGDPQHVINLFTFIAEDLRQIMRSLGARKVSDLVGRSDLLAQRPSGIEDLDSLDLNALLLRLDKAEEKYKAGANLTSVARQSLDETILKDAEPLFSRREKMQLQYEVSNHDRTLGGRMASAIVTRIKDPLPPGHLTLRFLGTAGQSLGAFAVKGMRIQLTGEANDYVGKGLSGGEIIIRRASASNLMPHQNTICGNTVLYGATSGKLYAAGRMAERFAVRNSGALAVIEGCGANGCEYMTGGLVVILGSVGENFAAGMTGGHAIIYDPDSRLERLISSDTVSTFPLETAYWIDEVERHIEDHHRLTRSPWARVLLEDWGTQHKAFKHVVPLEILKLGMLSNPVSDILPSKTETARAKVAS